MLILGWVKVRKEVKLGLEPPRRKKEKKKIRVGGIFAPRAQHGRVPQLLLAHH